MPKSNLKRPTRYFSKRQEKRTSKKLDMKVTPNSGATGFIKGDVIDENLILECKTLVKPQNTRTIHKEWFTKTEEEMYQMGKDLYGVVFDFGDGDDFVAVPLKTFEELYTAYKNSLE